jgi:FKBP-type peptidyl-prolyl cis-trans isomerase FkpA
LTNQEFQAAINKYVVPLTSAIKNAEPGKIKKYITDKKLNITKTDSGLYYTIIKKGKGPLARPGDTVVVDYTGYLLNGKIFDSSVYADAVKGKIVNPKREYGPIGIPIGEKKVIAGWDQGLMLLPKATKATFIIPSKLAYAEKGYGGIIAPYTPLVYDIWVANIIPPKPGTHISAKK